MGAAGIVAWWVAFAGSHMGLSSLRLRPRLVAALGERGFQGVYSLVAFATFVPLVSTYYAHKHAGPLLWSLAGVPGSRPFAYALIGIAFSLVVAGLVQPSPASLTPGKAELRGVARITRHPLLMGFGLWGLAHLLAASVNAAELAFFGGFPLFALVGCAHQDRRKRATLGEPYRAWCAATPFLPFTRAGWLAGLREPPLPAAIAGGIALAYGLRQAHGWLAG